MDPPSCRKFLISDQHFKFAHDEDSPFLLLPVQVTTHVEHRKVHGGEVGTACSFSARQAILTMLMRTAEMPSLIIRC